MRHLLAIEGLDRAQLEHLLDRAEACAVSAPRREGCTVVNLFLEPSTRTRVSFEIAAKRMGAQVVNVSPAVSSIVKGETLADTAATLDAMEPDVIVIRHSFAGASAFLAARVKASVINAGDGQHEHPTQGLLDALAIRRARGKVAGLKVAIVGDLKHSRVARSSIRCLSTLGAEVAVFGPASLIPRGMALLGCTVAESMEEALAGANVVMTLRLQQERMAEAFLPSNAEYARCFRIDAARMKLAVPGALLMHPGPMNRGVEVSSALADSAASLVTAQVAAGVPMRMAVLDVLLESRAAQASRQAGPAQAKPSRSRVAVG